MALLLIGTYDKYLQILVYTFARRQRIAGEANHNCLQTSKKQQRGPSSAGVTVKDGPLCCFLQRGPSSAGVTVKVFMFV